MAWNEYQPTEMYPPEVAKPLKRLFAHTLVRFPDNPYEAAREIEQHPGKAHWIATNWVEDEDVLQERSKLIAERGPIAKVPTKEEFAAEIYLKARKIKDGTKEQLQYYETFAKIMSYLDTSVKVKGDAENPIKHEHTARWLSDDELARIATNGSK